MTFAPSIAGGTAAAHPTVTRPPVDAGSPPWDAPPAVGDLRERILECLEGTQNPDTEAPTVERLHGWVDPFVPHGDFYEALDTLRSDRLIDIYGLKLDGQWVARWVRLLAPPKPLDPLSLKRSLRVLKAGGSLQHAMDVAAGRAA